MKVRRFSKAVAAAAVLVAAWILAQFGLEVPAPVQGGVVTLLVWAVPNADPEDAGTS
jgi:hypothetical protein